MSKLFFGFIILLLAIWVGYLVHQDSGYVLIAYHKWSLETSLWVGIVAVILAFFLFYFILRLISHTSSVGSRIQQRRQTRQDRKAKKLTDVGLCELAEGNWQKAENILIKAAKNSATPLINYLAAARAAQEQQAFDRRSNYLRQAHHSNPEAEIAVGLTQAQLQIHTQQWEQALATLKHLNQINPNHKFIFKLLADVYLELKDWQQLLEILPKLRKQKILDTGKLTNLTEHVYVGLLNHAAATQTINDINNVWQQIPKAWRHNVKVAKTYVYHLIRHQQNENALSIIQNILKKTWDDDLIELYGLATSDNTAEQITQAEAWLQQNPQNSTLLLCLGRLCMREQLWGKARYYLQQCTAIAAKPEIYQALGQVFEALGDKEQALACYRKVDINM